MPNTITKPQTLFLILSLKSRNPSHHRPYPTHQTAFMDSWLQSGFSFSFSHYPFFRYMRLTKLASFRSHFKYLQFDLIWRKYSEPQWLRTEVVHNSNTSCAWITWWLVNVLLIQIIVRASQQDACCQRCVTCWQSSSISWILRRSRPSCWFIFCSRTDLMLSSLLLHDRHFTYLHRPHTVTQPRS